ncbi:MAG TPA: alpha/beta hydrolase [Thermoanaerobaculia bacterium]|jgi:alpha-beta hydrolase superfamily lysophospholipase|nr:alpha/beta hydrolase [Thermoanaerobaculia bacterium]
MLSTVRTADGIELATEHHLVPGCRGRLVIVHGYAEHKGRYGELVDQLVGAGYQCHLLDLRGHGRSGGPRGHVARFEDYRTDLERFMEEVRKLATPAPLLLLGHSLGGLIALDFVLHHSEIFDSLTVSSPFLAPALQIPFLKRTLLPFVANFFSSLAVQSGLRAAWLSHDAQVVHAYETDPLVFSTVTLGWFVAVRNGQQEVFDRAGEIRTPILGLLGDADAVADPNRTRRLFERLGSEPKRLIAYPGLFHEVFNELERGRVAADFLAWLGERTAR